MHGSDGGDSSTDRETLDKEDKQPDIFTVCRDQPGVKTSPDVLYGSDDRDSSTDRETLDKEDKQPDLFTVYRDESGVEINSEVMYESDGGDSFADQDTLDKEDKKAAEPCRIDTDQPLAITSTENKNEGDLGDTSRDMDDKGKRRSDLFTVYRDSPAVISSTESISGSDVSDPSVEVVTTFQVTGMKYFIFCKFLVVNHQLRLWYTQGQTHGVIQGLGLLVPGRQNAVLQQP
ncbi:uncharacterized protein [Aquarana catesbeiana]|uniref:uncharacterized protein n=1 Tax=Aquarana catesbeiana TaxID=8400 RepID=UPI003CC9CC06